MVTNMVEKLNALDDFHAVEFLQHLSQMLLDGVVDDVDRLLEGVPSYFREKPEYVVIKNLALGETEAELTDAESVAISRQFLKVLAQDPAISPLVEQAWETYSGMTLDASKTILSTALAAVMIIFAATSEAEFRVGDATFKKEAASPELVQAIIAPMTEIAKAVSSSKTR
jgi:hypothetical protein